MLEWWRHGLDSRKAVSGLSRLAHWALIALAILGLVIGASGCSNDAESSAITPLLAHHESDSHVVEQAASAHLARSRARLKALRHSWAASRQPMDDVLLHEVAEVEYRLEAAARSLAFVQQAGGDDLNDMREGLSPALDDVDTRIDRLRARTRRAMGSIAESSLALRKAAAAPAALGPKRY